LDRFWSYISSLCQLVAPARQLVDPARSIEMTIEAQGLYDPSNEHDACGVGFVAHIKGKKSHDIVQGGLKILENIDHRGAVGADPLMGDGAGILIQIPDT
jgi:glutamate synthase (NADPH/NADH) large chain